MTMCLWRPFAPLSSPLPGGISTPTHRSPPPSFHFYLTSSNYFRVIPASRRLKKHWETKPTAPPTDPSATQLQPGTTLYVTNCIAAAMASGSNRVFRGCVPSEGRGGFYPSAEKLKHFRRQNGKRAFLCYMVAIIKPTSRLILSAYKGNMHI